MRLLNVHTLKLHTFYGDAIPPYAILSHTWLQDAQEVTFSQLQADPVSWRNIEGSLKIDFLCQQAINDGYDYAWMDTCCIDKTNNSELSEAINSMFQWYQKSRVCYAYMADVEYGSEVDLMSSRWWSRAWTLQELLAPRDVKFYDTHWRLIGTKNDLSESIYSNTGINLETLRDPQCISESCVAQRMSWAAQRQATRTEDLAYSLLGIFGINMPLQYGEGKGAFVRLQQEILKTKNDQSLFAW
ncbi:HET-domain-containing protein, partial [Dothidotthia symphoricarpi CBS 119687]